MTNQLSKEDHICTHPLGQCKKVPTSGVIPNSFNIVLDKDNPDICHVLQCSMVIRGVNND